MRSFLRATGVTSILLVAPVALQAQQAADTVTTLDELIVTGSRQPEALSQLAASATVLKREQLVARQSWTIDRALQDIPGVTLTGDASYGQEARLSMRGLTSGFGTQRALVMLDGRPLTDEYLGHVDLAQFPLLSMDRVEVVRGPASAAYGSNALGGVINLIPLRGGSRPRTELLMQGGSFGTVSPSVSHSRSSGAVDVAANASYHRTNGYLDNSQGQNMDWARQNGFLNLGYTGTKVALRGYTFYSHGSGTDQDFDRKASRISQDASITIVPDQDGQFVSRAQLYYTHLNEDIGWFDRPASEYRHHTIGGILSQQVRVGTSHNLLVGTDLKRSHVDARDATGVVDRSENTWALFAQDRVRIGEWVTLQVGARGDKPDGNELTWSGRGGINVRLTPTTVAVAAAGRAFRTPTLSDRYLPTTSAFGLVFEGNPDLKPETLTSVELGLRQRLGVAEIGATAFGSRAKGFWDFLPQEDGVFRPTNIAEVEIRGLELTSAVTIARRLQLEMSYTYTDATYEKFEGNDEAVGNRLDDNVRHAVTGSIAWTSRRGDMLRVDARRYGNRVTDPNDPPGSRLDPWTAVDLSGALRLTPALELSATLRNAFDETYRTRPEFRQAGRALLGSVRVEW
jgi:outer membrane cobalamin receptor